MITKLKIIVCVLRALRLGFKVVSEEFLEAGLPHVDMVRDSQ